MKNVVIAAYTRSPFTPAHKGALVSVRADDLVAQVVKALVNRSGIDPAQIEDLILGCAFPEGEQGLNLARLVVYLAELPISIAGTTVNRFCGSSMQAIHFAAGSVFNNRASAFSAIAFRLLPSLGTISSKSTGIPALAIWAAIPAPITPAPITATR